MPYNHLFPSPVDTIDRASTVLFYLANVSYPDNALSARDQFGQSLVLDVVRYALEFELERRLKAGDVVSAP